MIQCVIFLILLPMMIWSFLGYPIVLYLIGKKCKNVFPLKDLEVPVSILIATHNEASVIDRRIENLLNQNYPKDKLEIIVVDSGSTDGTRESIKKRWAKEVTLLEQTNRMGKASAINLALKKAHGEIIVLSDAPTIHQPDTLRKVVQNFSNPQVGGVTGKFKPVGRDNGVQEVEKFLWKIKDSLRILESKADSTQLSGELCAFRRQLIDKIDEDALADDMNITFKIREKGMRTIIDHRVESVEKIPDKSEYVDIKVRRALGGIREMFRFKHMILNPHFGLFGILILPTRFMIQLISPWLLLSCLVLLMLFVINFFPFILSIYTVTLVFVLATIPFFLRKSVVIKAAKTFLCAELILLIAMVRYIVGDFDVRWVQAKSERLSMQGCS